jgi:hypothetical protein
VAANNSNNNNKFKAIYFCMTTAKEGQYSQALKQKYNVK